MSQAPVPAVPYIAIDGDDRWLKGSKCAACGAVLLGERIACAACGARTIEPLRLSTRGRLHTYTIVHRSFPGVATPFVSVVVDLDGGGCVRGTLRGVTPSPDAVRPGMRLRLEFGDSGQSTREGAPFLAFTFAPETESAHV